MSTSPSSTPPWTHLLAGSSGAFSSAALLLRIFSSLAWLGDNTLDALATEELNGREIKNAIRAAHALAEADGERLALEHIMTVLETMRAFDLDLNGVEGRGGEL